MSTGQQKKKEKYIVQFQENFYKMKISEAILIVLYKTTFLFKILDSFYQIITRGSLVKKKDNVFA